MDTIGISRRLLETSYLIRVFLGDELISSGSGVAVNSHGDLLTAAHVVTGRLPVRQGDLDDPRVNILATRSFGDLVDYEPIGCGIQFDSESFTQPITVDLALLRPKSSRTETPFLEVSDATPLVGTQVLMAGFPDDMELPFSLDRVVDFRRPEVKNQHRRLPIERDRVPMVKLGMVGFQAGVVFTSQKDELRGNVFYIDSTLHTGASGGPVVNEASEVLGILTKRAMTAVPLRQTPKLKVPSGSSVAISPRIVKHLIASRTWL